MLNKRRVVLFGLVAGAVLATSLPLALLSGSVPRASAATACQNAGTAYDAAATPTQSYQSTVAAVESWQETRTPGAAPESPLRSMAFAADAPVEVCYYSGNFDFPGRPGGDGYQILSLIITPDGKSFVDAAAPASGFAWGPPPAS